MKKLLNIFVVSFALVFSSNLFANKIGVIYDSGGKFDKSFNELAFKTAERVKNELCKICVLKTTLQSQNNFENNVFINNLFPIISGKGFFGKLHSCLTNSM